MNKQCGKAEKKGGVAFVSNLDMQGNLRFLFAGGVETALLYIYSRWKSILSTSDRTPNVAMRDSRTHS